MTKKKKKDSFKLNFNELEDALVGTLHDYTHIKEVMEDYDFYHYFGDIDKDSILKLMAY